MPGLFIAMAGAAVLGYALFSPFRVVVGFRFGKPFPLTVRTVGKLQNGNRAWLSLTAATAFEAMREAARNSGLDLPIASAFRTWEEQALLKAKYLLAGGYVVADPGYSNHQEGTTVDLDVGGKNWQNNQRYHWLRANAGAYGFVDDVYPGTAKYEAHHWHYVMG